MRVSERPSLHFERRGSHLAILRHLPGNIIALSELAYGPRVRVVEEQPADAGQRLDGEELKFDLRLIRVNEARGVDLRASRAMDTYRWSGYL